MRYSGFHRAIGILQGEHQRTWPIHFCNEIEADRLDALRQRYKAAGLNPPSYTAMVVKAIGLAIKEVSAKYPEVNSYLSSVCGWRRIHTFEAVSAGVAISREEEGMDVAVCGVVQHPDQTDLVEITKQLGDFATLPLKDVPYLRNAYYLFRLPGFLQRLVLWVGRTFARSRFVYRGTFTLTSVGKFGVDYQMSLPQASSLQFGFGAVRERPVVRDGAVVPCRTFFLTMSFDRRLMNGKPCSMVIERIRDILNAADFAEARSMEGGAGRAPGAAAATAT